MWLFFQLSPHDHARTFLAVCVRFTPLRACFFSLCAGSAARVHPPEQFAHLQSELQSPGTAHKVPSAFRDMLESFRKRRLDELVSLEAEDKPGWKALRDAILSDLPDATSLETIALIRNKLQWLDETPLGNDDIHETLWLAENRYHQIITAYCGFMGHCDVAGPLHKDNLASYVDKLNDVRAATQQYADIVNSDRWNTLVAALVCAREKCFSGDVVEANQRVARLLESRINATDRLELVACWHSRLVDHLEDAIQSPKKYSLALKIFESLHHLKLWCAESPCQCKLPTACCATRPLFIELQQKLRDLRFAFAEPQNFLVVLKIVQSWRDLRVTQSSGDALEDLKLSFHDVKKKLMTETESPFRNAEEMVFMLLWARTLNMHFDALQSQQYFGDVASLKPHIHRQLAAADSMIAWTSWRPKRVAAYVAAFLIRVWKRTGRVFNWPQVLIWPQVQLTRDDSGEPSVHGIKAFTPL
jgi:hypothetical protein